MKGKRTNRSFRNTPVTIHGVTRTLREWAAVANIPYRVIFERYQRGVRGPGLIAAVRKYGRRYGPPPPPPAPEYTEDELFELYKNFHGQHKELRILADFCGYECARDAAPMLARLKERLENGQKN